MMLERAARVRNAVGLSGVVGRPRLPSGLLMAIVGWVAGGVACSGAGATDGESTDGSDESDGSGGDVSLDTIPDDGEGGDQVTADVAGDIRLPLYGVCVPGRQGCSADGRYVEVCSGDGEWVPFTDCEGLRWRLPESGLAWECGGGVGSGELATCHQCSRTPAYAGCALGACSFGGHGVYPPGLLGFVSRCDDGGATLTLYAGSLSPMCGEEVPYPEVCESLSGWAMWCRASCDCSEGVYEVRDSEGAVATTMAYGSCGDTFIGRPDYWADDVTREAAARLLPELQNIDGSCNEATRFPYMYDSCAVLGSGYCIRDEHCGTGQHCDLSSLAGRPSRWDLGLDYPHCE